MPRFHEDITEIWSQIKYQIHINQTQTLSKILFNPYDSGLVSQSPPRWLPQRDEYQAPQAVLTIFPNHLEAAAAAEGEE
jgi:hypothetical protein